MEMIDVLSTAWPDHSATDGHSRAAALSAALGPAFIFATYSVSVVVVESAA